MPSSEIQRNNKNPTRPLMPKLASSRDARSPVALKLIGHVRPSTAPLSPASTRSEVLLSPTNQPPASLSTPVKSFVANNITPRSSRRQSRVDGVNITPATLPNGNSANEPVQSPISPSEGLSRGSVNQGLGISGLQVPAAKRAKSVIAEGDSTNPGYFAQVPGGSPLALSVSSRGESEESPCFFRADEAKSHVSSKRPPLVKQTSSFYYANGEPEQAGAGPEKPATSSIAGSEGARSDSKVLHAHEICLSPSTLQLQASLGPVIPPISAILPPRPSPGSKSRSPSPSKENTHFPYVKRTSPVNPLVAHRPPIAPGIPTTYQIESTHPTRRRSSTEVAMIRPSHSRTFSSCSIGAKLASKPASRSTSGDHTNTLTGISISMSSSLTSPSVQANSRPKICTAHSARSDVSNGSALAVQSPTMTDPQEFADVAASARHERKVLDLEISNSSLLAINRTLEREVRKQKVELRRFRRLSRTGRLSVATSHSSMGLSALAEEADGPGDDGDAILPYELTDEEDFSEDASVDDEALSPGALAINDAKHRAEDERRLEADLSRHRQLLIDSTKMNQSLKCCLAWTDELLKEGKKALEYRVRISDVKLGGRILPHEDEEKDSPSGRDVMREDADCEDVLGLRNEGDSDLERLSIEFERTGADCAVE